MGNITKFKKTLRNLRYTTLIISVATSALPGQFLYLQLIFVFLVELIAIVLAISFLKAIETFFRDDADKINDVCKANGCVVKIDPFI